MKFNLKLTRLNLGHYQQNLLSRVLGILILLFFMTLAYLFCLLFHIDFTFLLAKLQSVLIVRAISAFLSPLGWGLGGLLITLIYKILDSESEDTKMLLSEESINEEAPAPPSASSGSSSSGSVNQPIQPELDLALALHQPEGEPKLNEIVNLVKRQLEELEEGGEVKEGEEVKETQEERNTRISHQALTFVELELELQRDTAGEEIEEFLSHIRREPEVLKEIIKEYSKGGFYEEGKLPRGVKRY